MIETLRLSFDPLVSWPLYWGLLGLAAITFLIYMGTYRRAWLSRFLLLALGFLVLANPNLVEEEREPLPSVVAVVVDDSESMAFGDRSEIASAAYSAVEAAIAANAAAR